MIQEALIKVSNKESLKAMGIGGVVGTLSGLTGVGGGVVLVPLLVGVLKVPQHRAHGTSLAAVFFIGLFSAVQYATRGYVDLILMAELVVMGFIGMFVGAKFMLKVPAGQLRRAFGVLLVGVALSMWFKEFYMSQEGFKFEAGHVTVLRVLIGTSIGLVAGFLGGLLGVGGGVVMVPAMVLGLNIAQHTAQGVSLAVLACTSTVGATTHYRQGTVAPNVALWVVPSALLCTFLGTWLASILPALWLTKVFGVVLFFTGLNMVFRR